MCVWPWPRNTRRALPSPVEKHFDDAVRNVKQLERGKPTGKGRKSDEGIVSRRSNVEALQVHGDFVESIVAWLFRNPKRMQDGVAGGNRPANTMFAHDAVGNYAGTD